MTPLTFAPSPSYPIVLLVPALRGKEIQREYLETFGIPECDVQCVPLHYTGKKTPISEVKQFVTEELVPFLNQDQGISYLVVADAMYFKFLTGQASAEDSLGYVKDCLYGPWKCVYVPSYRQVFYDPDKTRAKIGQGLNALLAHIGGTYQDPGKNIVHFEEYPKTLERIEYWLEKLLAMDLAIDIEAFSLKHHKSGIGTITFCWNKHEGVAFPVDYAACEPYVTEDGKTHYGRSIRNEEVRRLLKRFFVRYFNKAIYHNISFDVYILVYQLFMEDVLDTDGMLMGMGIMLKNWDCTQLITYLATNTCAGNELGLKANSQEYSGDYAMEDDDLKDITLIPLDKLLRYNLIDGLSTWYVYEKNQPKMLADNQLQIYTELFKPAIWDIIQMQLTGLPLSMPRVKQIKVWLQAIQDDALKRMMSSQVVQQFTYLLREKHVADRNQKLKKKRITLTDPETLAVEFNPNSGPQKQELLYEMLGLPVIALTKSKLPSTSGDTLEKLFNHAKNQDVKDFIQSLLDYTAVNKLLTDFIPNFEEAVQGPDGWHYLIGSFRLGGTLSGRLSSSNPNLQNLPANVEMLISALLLNLFPELKKFVSKGKLHLGKLIKWCFQAPPGWVFCGLDFASLEDRISALTTKDPNKLKVYTDGYDGHSLRAYAYFGHRMTGIDPTSVASINSIQSLYKKERQDSKAPTFALTYQGTWMTLMKNCGFSEEESKSIESKYHILYVVSDAWVQDKLKQAGKDGFITAAFGLRIRTPLLAQVIRGTSKTPYEAEAEGRSAGNALGQSWCLLTNRSAVEFMGVVRQGPYRLDIRPCAHIHDAQYYLVREDVATLLYANTHLVKAVQWQDHPEISHPDVHLGGVFSIFWPDWSHDIEVPNGADEAGLMAALEARLERT